MALFRMAFFVFQALFSSFRVADFVIPSFGQALFRLFVVSRGVISSFLRGVFRRLPSVISSFRRAITPAEKTKWHKSATIETTSLFNSEDHEIPKVVRSNPVRTIPKV